MGLKWHDFLLIAICVVLLVATTLFVVLNYAEFPEEMPINYDFQGNVTGTGGRGNIVVITVMNWVMSAGLIVSLFFPQVWNVPSVKPQNAARAANIVRKMIEALTILILLFMGYMILTMAQVLPMINMALTLFIVLLVVITAVPLLMMRKLK